MMMEKSCILHQEGNLGQLLLGFYIDGLCACQRRHCDRACSAVKFLFWNRICYLMFHNTYGTID